MFYYDSNSFFVHNVFFQNYIKDLFFVRTLIYTNTVINNIDKSNIGDGTVLFINNQTDLIWGTLVSENNNIFSLYYGIHPKVVIWKDKEDLYSKVLQKGFNSQDYIVYPISYDELKICNYANYTECLTDIK